MDRMCPIYGRECWDCIDAFREIVHRSTTGATIHKMNGILLVMLGSCSSGDSASYSQGLKELMNLLRQKNF